jgi:hypothetical protein
LIDSSLLTQQTERRKTAPQLKEMQAELAGARDVASSAHEVNKLLLQKLENQKSLITEQSMTLERLRTSLKDSEAQIAKESAARGAFERELTELRAELLAVRSSLESQLGAVKRELEASAAAEAAAVRAANAAGEARDREAERAVQLARALDDAKRRARVDTIGARLSEMATTNDTSSPSSASSTPHKGGGVVAPPAALTSESASSPSGSASMTSTTTPALGTSALLSGTAAFVSRLVEWARPVRRRRTRVRCRM